VDEDTTFVGLDTHKRSIHVAMLRPDAPAQEHAMTTDGEAVRRWAKRVLRQSPGRVVCAYEAGPLGFALQRQLVGLGLACQVVAPSLIPVKPGERVKTDRRDARKLAEMLRAGLLVEVYPPSPQQEAVRDLCRAREAAKRDLHRCRQRLSKFLLRRALLWTPGRQAWTKAHRTWLRGLQLEHAADQFILDDHLLAVDQLEARLAGVESELEAISQTTPYREPVGWLRCFRGIDTITAMTIVAELHEPQRFQSPRDLMAYLGLVPSEHSSGERRRRGTITKAGNGHIRRVLVEAAWHYRHRPGVGIKLRQRRRGQPARVIAIADRAQQRLCRRFRRLTERGKPPNKVVVAIARELAGFLWAVMTPSEHPTA
jgi:transposase